MSAGLAQLQPILDGGRRRPALPDGAHRVGAGVASPRDTAPSSARTRARRCRRAASGCGRCSSTSAPATRRPRTTWSPPASPSSCCTWRRSSTTTCSTRPTCAAGGRPCSRSAAATPRRRPATCSSRARSPSWPPPARPTRRAFLSDASSALARGELIQRADAWAAEVPRARYIERCELKTARLFEAACRLGATLGCPGHRRGRPARRLRPPHRHRVPDLRRRARRLRAGRADRQGARDRPARRHGHAAADPRARARSVAGGARPAQRRSRAPRRRRRSATGSRRPARSRRRARRRCSTSATRRAGWTHSTCRASQRRLLELVADGVVERYA